MDDYGSNEDTIPNMEENYGTLMEFLTDNPEMKKAAVHSLRQGLMAGGGAVVGGLILGPVGGLVGGIAGSLVGYFQAPNYEGMVQNIRHLEKSRQDQLMSQVKVVLLAAGATATSMQNTDQFKQVLVQYAAQAPVRDQIWKACVQALEHE